MYRLAVYFIALSLFAASVDARSKSDLVDRDYLSALAVAGKFLGAWQAQDQETAILLLSDRLREPGQEDRLHILFSASGAQSAFELCRGRKLAPDRYEFPAVLYQVSAHSPKWQHPHPTSLIVVHTGQDDWLIDKLP